MASRSGIRHGLLVSLLALLVTLVLAIVGAVLGASFIDRLTGLMLPGPMQDVANGITRSQNLGTILGVSGILALLVPFVDGAIGGAWGAKTARDRP